jgi:hypothetical protein
MTQMIRMGCGGHWMIGPWRLTTLRRNFSSWHLVSRQPPGLQWQMRGTQPYRVFVTPFWKKLALGRVNLLKKSGFSTAFYRHR